MSLGTNITFTEICDQLAAPLTALFIAAENLRQNGTILVAAAGNEGLAGALPAPACLSNVVTVGASTMDDQAAPFSNSHEVVALHAPGVDIESDNIDGGTIIRTGTSMAAPHVAGLSALIVETRPAIIPEVMVAAMQNTGIPITDLFGLTRRRIDAKGAVDQLLAPFVPGDVNGDSVVSLSDLFLLYPLIFESGNPPSPEDCRPDNLLNILDLVCILNIIGP